MLAAATTRWQKVWFSLRVYGFIQCRKQSLPACALNPQISQVIYHLLHPHRRPRMRSFYLCYRFPEPVTQTAVVLGTIVFPAKGILNVSRQVLKHLSFVNVE